MILLHDAIYRDIENTHDNCNRPTDLLYPRINGSSDEIGRRDEEEITIEHEPRSDVLL